MKPVVVPAPASDPLRELPLHVLVRDFPEVLPVLQEAGVDPGPRGCVSLDSLSSERPDLAGRVEEAIAWRRSPLSGARLEG